MKVRRSYSVGCRVSAFPELDKRDEDIPLTLDHVVDDIRSHRDWFRNADSSCRAIEVAYERREAREADWVAKGNQTSLLPLVERCKPSDGGMKIRTNGHLRHPLYIVLRQIPSLLSPSGFQKLQETMQAGTLPLFAGSTVSINLLPRVRDAHTGQEDWVLAHRDPEMVAVYQDRMAPFVEGVECKDADLRDASTRGASEELGIDFPLPFRPVFVASAVSREGCDTGLAVAADTGLTLDQLQVSIARAHDGAEAAALGLVPLGGDIPDVWDVMPWTPNMFGAANDRFLLQESEGARIVPAGGATLAG